MAAKKLKTLDVRSRQEWREWLAARHASEAEIWLVFHKRHTAQESISYDDAIDEALCFGWVDSLVKRLDLDRYGASSHRGGRTAGGPPSIDGGTRS